MKLRRVLPVFVVLVLVGVLFVGVFPTRTWLAQRREMSGAIEQLRVLEEQNGLLEKRVGALQSDDEIERLAREQYNLVKPGEEAYALLPPTSAASQPAPLQAATHDKPKRNLAQRAWDFLTGWL